MLVHKVVSLRSAEFKVQAVAPRFAVLRSAPVAKSPPVVLQSDRPASEAEVRWWLAPVESPRASLASRLQDDTRQRLRFGRTTTTGASMVAAGTPIIPVLGLLPVGHQVPLGMRARGTMRPVTLATAETPPVYYDYGNNVTYEDDVVYMNGDEVGTSEEYYEQAATLATAGAEVDAPADSDWLPLGVFALTKPDETDSVVTIQLAVNKDGILRGNYTDTDSGQDAAHSRLGRQADAACCLHRRR